MRPRAAPRKEHPLNITDILRLFPAVIAPAIVDRLRRRWPELDGLLVWPVVVAVAVALSVLGALTAGPVTLAGAVAAAREGLALGLAAVGLHYLARGKAAPQGAPVVREKPVMPEPSTSWGPRPSGE
jgi:hypothetical protein